MTIDPRNFPATQPLKRADGPRVLKETQLPRFSTTGSTVRAILPQPEFTSAVSQFALVEARGTAIIILSGAHGNVRDGQLKPRITMLLGSEDGNESLVVQQRQFRDDEIYEGAVLIGNFERLLIEWKTAIAVTEPLRIRVVDDPGLRTVPVVTNLANTGHNQRLDFFDGQQITIPALGQIVIYNDDSSPLWDGFSVPAIGEGIGGHVQQSLHPEWKNRLLCHVASTTAAANFSVTVFAYIQATTARQIVWHGDSVIRGPAGTTPATGVVTVGAFRFGGTVDSGGGTSQQFPDGLVVPPKIMVRAHDETGGAGLAQIANVWLSFAGT